MPNLSEISLSDYSRLKYDEFLELVRYCRYLLEIDIPGNISEILGKQLLEYQKQGYDLLKGKSFDGTQYVLLNKNKILSIQYEKLEEQTRSL